MAGSVFGKEFRLCTFGESHGKGVGVIVEGVRPGLKISEEDIQKQLDRRKPGQSDVTTPRKESDIVHIISGVYDGQATGCPLAMVIWNSDARPSSYDHLSDLFRPGHADYTFQKKYGIRDHRGSGRASGRETAARVAAGAIAMKMLADAGVQIRAFTRQVGPIVGERIDYDAIETNPVRAADPDKAEAMTQLIREVGAAEDSIGGVVECRVQNVPVGLGEPVFDKLDADLAKAVLSLGAVKGVEFGEGFGAVTMRGSQHNDSITPQGFATNHAGGILGGISNGADIIFRVAVKPTSSIATQQQTVNTANEAVNVCVTGRHDPCICPRIVPVVEAMTALVLIDHLKRQKALHV